MTRITSPAETHSMSSPGWIWYSSAILLGTVTWYLDVTLAMYASEARSFLTLERIKTLFKEGRLPRSKNYPEYYLRETLFASSRFLPPFAFFSSRSRHA